MDADQDGASGLEMHPCFPRVAARAPRSEGTYHVNLLLTWFPLLDAGDGEDGDDDEEERQAAKAPKQLSSKALMELAEGEEDLVEDLQLSDQED